MIILSISIIRTVAEVKRALKLESPAKTNYNILFTTLKTRRYLFDSSILLDRIKLLVAIVYALENSFLLNVILSKYTKDYLNGLVESLERKNSIKLKNTSIVNKYSA